MRINLFSDAENLSFLAIAALLIVAGCSKNAPDTLYKENKQDLSAGLSVKEAMLWYENHPAPQKAFRNEASGRYAYKIRTAYWDRAINAMDSNYYIVEAPVVFDQSPGFIISGSADQPNDVARLLILKNKKTGEMHSALMHIVSDNGTEELSITYNKRSSRFSGFIFYTDTEGNFINGWKYENGKITRKSSKGAGVKKTVKRVGTGPAVSLMAPPDVPPVDCSTYTITVYVRDCEYYPSGEKNCTPWRIEDQYEQTYCTGGGGSSGDGGGISNEEDIVKEEITTSEEESNYTSEDELQSSYVRIIYHFRTTIAKNSSTGIITNVEIDPVTAEPIVSYYIDKYGRNVTRTLTLLDQMNSYQLLVPPTSVTVHWSFAVNAKYSYADSSAVWTRQWNVNHSEIRQ